MKLSKIRQDARHIDQRHPTCALSVIVEVYAYLEQTRSSDELKQEC